MDYYYNEYCSSNNSKFYYVKKLTQIIISLSLFSFLISQSSLAIILINSYNNYFVPIKIFTYTTERNCIFLLCNGILVLIIQTSGLVAKVTPLDQSSPKGTNRIYDRLDRETIENRLDEFQENKAKNVGIINVVEENETEIINSNEDYESCGINNQESEFEEDDDEHEEEEEEDDDEHEEEEDDDDEGVDELNKKCEDFIKKMKQEIQGTPK